MKPEHQSVGYASVISMSAESAIRFFGFGFGPEAVAIDVGPAPSGLWKPGARRFRVYRNAADLRADGGMPS